MTDHLTDEFSLEALKKGEEIALMDYDFGANMRQRWTNFRNALIHVAVENPLPGSIAAQPVLLPGEEAPLPLHVMVVDDSPHVLKLHESLIRHLVPEARIQTCSRLAPFILCTLTGDAGYHLTACGVQCSRSGRLLEDIQITE